MANKLVNMAGEVIPQTVEISTELSQAIKQRLTFIAQAQHSVECMKLELEHLIKREIPETADSKNIAINPEVTQIQHS